MSEAIPGLLAPAWGSAGRVRVISTTRVGGLGRGAFSTLNLGARGRDDTATIDANRARLSAALGLDRDPGWLRQVHGTTVVGLDGSLSAPPEADAAWTATPGFACAVLTADCLPVAIVDPDGASVAVAHAGWRGLAAGILEATVDALPVSPERLRVWLGPAIGPDAFEVGPEVRDSMLAGDPAAAPAFRPGRGDRWHADLYVLARRRLRRAGVGRIDGGGHCTFHESARFFSHRRDGPATGRMATLAWIAPS